MRRETGKEVVVQVHCNEGGAVRVGPEPCVTVREGRDEASGGECTGQPLNLADYLNGSARRAARWA
jgi:hypothetical protein